MDPVIQRENLLYQQFRQHGAGVQRQQKWGDSVLLPMNQSVVLDVVQPEQIFVDVGPFAESRPIFLDTDVLPRVQAGSAFFLNRPCYSYRLVIGVGDAAIVEETQVLPTSVFCTSLQVYARRLVAAVGGALDPFKKAIWASLNAETPSSPQVIGYETFTLGIGTALATANPPWWATHFFATTGPGENSQRVGIQATSPPNSLSGVSTGAAAFYSCWSGTASAPAAPPTPVPMPRNMTKYEFRREVTTASQTYTVWYCR